MEFTQKDLVVLYDRIIQIGISKYKETADRVLIHSDGTITIQVDKYSYGSYTDEYDILPEDLTADLDELVKERLEKEETQAVIRKEQLKKQQEEKIIKDKEAEILMLKKLREKYPDIS